MGNLVRFLPARSVPLIIGSLILRGHNTRSMVRESLRIHTRPYLEHDGAAALARQVAWLDVRDTLAVADRVRDLDVPARVVWGAADRFQKVAYGNRFAWDLGTELRRIEGGKHFVPEDHPDIVAAAIGEVLGAA